MALQSEVSPPIVGDPNKDTQIDGDTKSDENDSEQSTEEEEDLEEGEILDSGAEEEAEKDFTNSSLKEALDESCLQNIEQLLNQAKNAKTTVSSPDRSKLNSPRKPPNKIMRGYHDHDQQENSSEPNDGWFRSSPTYKPKFEHKTMDYRTELEAYRGTPPSSPERKKRDDKPRKKKSSKKSKKPKKAITRKDARGQRVYRFKKDSALRNVCKFFKEGKCAKGADCLYSHSIPNLPSYKKKELCKFYLNGHCNKGKDCLYMHGDFPCKFFHTGSECYAKDDCRFSHATLTEEMKKVLADYLRMSHGDDVRLGGPNDREREERSRKRHRSSPSPEPHPPPPPPKRTCLLGSPPRHIREAEETRRWQEEMKMLQQQSHPGFEIRLSPRGGSPPPFAKPNFYQETLLNTPSPKRRGHQQSHDNDFHDDASDDYGSPSKVYVYDEDEFIEIEVPPIVKQEPQEEYRWESTKNNKLPEENNTKHYEDDSQPETDFTSDVKFDETTQFSEMESSTDGPPLLSPDSASQAVPQDADDSQVAPSDDKTPDEPPAPPIVVPSHLPRKQQELLMRVLQHQRRTATNPAAEPSAANSDDPSREVKKEVLSDEEVEKKEVEVEEKPPSKWYSSEEEDDDADVPLTDVLKKIQQAPPKPVVTESKPSPQVNLLEMFKKIQQKTIERTSSTKSHNKKPEGAFWDSLFGNAPAPKPVPIPSAAEADPRNKTLQPDSSTESTTVEPTLPKVEPDVPKDPRLKNRDPRKLANVPRTSTELNNSDPRTAANKDSNSALSNIPYRLRGISAKPLNYTPYISASQSNPNLLKDPRLRRHLPGSKPEPLVIGNGKEPDVKPAAPTPLPKNIPPIPQLLLKYEPSETINIFESSTKPMAKTPAEPPKPTPTPAPVVSDPRVKRRDSRSNSGSDTPPRLTIVDSNPTSTPPTPEQLPKTLVIQVEDDSSDSKDGQKWLPPVLENNSNPPVLQKNWLTGVKKESETDSDSSHDPPVLERGGNGTSSPKMSPSPPAEEFITIVKKEPSQVSTGDSPTVPPLIIKKVKPTPPAASHLPRAIADPRMARLHEHRRTPAAKKKTPDDEPKSAPPKSEIEEILQKDAKPPKSAKSIPKKRRLSDKSEDKKKPAHRNRKSSMDYASPLNSCDASNASDSLNYNQRPKRHQTEKVAPRKSSPPVIEQSDTSSSIPDFTTSEDVAVDCDNSSDINLKARFKTIDPTASPFC